jgi:hypothetical protein
MLLTTNAEYLTCQQGTLQVNSHYFFNAMAILFLFCCSITDAVRRWLKTQAAAEI